MSGPEPGSAEHTDQPDPGPPSGPGSGAAIPAVSPRADSHEPGLCRCHRCREAGAASGRGAGTGTTIEEWRRRLAAWSLRHGRAATYSYHGCRCPRCCSAWEHHRRRPARS